jgi:hypothetical protein
MGRERPIDRSSAATDAGLSERQRKTALRVANVPEVKFEESQRKSGAAKGNDNAAKNRQPKNEVATDCGNSVLGDPHKGAIARAAAAGVDRGTVERVEAVVLGRHGGDRRSEKTKEPDQERDTLLKAPRSDTVARVIGRLHRDRPDLEQAVQRGELSPNAAAIAAGFRAATWRVGLRRRFCTQAPGWGVSGGWNRRGVRGGYPSTYRRGSWPGSAQAVSPGPTNRCFATRGNPR